MMRVTMKGEHIMNRINRLGFLVVGVAAIAGPGSLARAADDAGAKVYAAKCASCHGLKGIGNPAMAKVFKVDLTVLDMTKSTTQTKTDADLHKIIAIGLNKMPAYASKLSDADISGLVSYLRSLAPPPANAPAKQ